MLPTIEKLLVLQDRDRKLIRLTAELEGAGPQRRMLEAKAAAAQAEFDAFKLKSKQLESDRKKLELEVSTKQQMIEKARTLQGATKKNDEYAAYQHQIDTTQKEISGLEDQQLELMEKSEAVAREIAARDKLLRQIKADVDKSLAEISSREANLKAEADAVHADRARLIGDIDESTRARYERILKTRGENIVVGVDRGVCGGCHMKLPTHLYLSTKAQQELVTCTNCSRILYYTRDMDDA